MAAPTYVAAGTFQAGTAGATPGLPAGWQQDDIFLLCCETRNGVGAAAPAGWTLIGTGPFANGSLASEDTALDVFWRRATASESAPVIGDTGNHVAARVHAFRGCIATGDPWDVWADGVEEVSDTSVSFPSVTTTVADTLVVIIGAFSDTASTSSPSNANLTSLTERADDTTTSGNDGALVLLTGVKSTAGSTGSTTATLSLSVFKAMQTIALKPAADPINYQEDFDDTLTLNDSQTLTESTAYSQDFDDPVTLEDSPTSEITRTVTASDTLTLEDSTSSQLELPAFSLTVTHNLNLLP